MISQNSLGSIAQHSIAEDTSLSSEASPSDYTSFANGNQQPHHWRTTGGMMASEAEWQAWVDELRGELETCRTELAQEKAAGMEYIEKTDRNHDQLRAENERLRAAIDWVLNDAAYKAPEQIGEAAQRWLGRLADARTAPSTQHQQRGDL